MKIQDDYLLVYARKDSQRLKDTFFSETKEKASKDNLVLFVLIGLVIFCTVAGIILAHYDVLMVKRTAIDIPKNSYSLLKNKNIHIDTSDEIERKGQMLYTALAPRNKATIKLNFTHPVDLRNKAILIYSHSNEPITIETLFKDSRFLSNARTPLFFETQKTNSDTYTPTALDFSKYSDNKINISSIQQLTLYLYPKNEGTRVLIKDIILTGNNSK